MKAITTIAVSTAAALGLNHFFEVGSRLGVVTCALLWVCSGSAYAAWLVHAHYAHPDGGESGTCRPLSQDDV